VWHDPVHERDPSTESPELKECFRYLDMTSRSFAAVIQELNHELLVPITLFYLCLRGLDTIEDDMTLPLDKKIPLLRNFHVTMEQEGWQFHESQEKDKELLEHFDVVITELKKLKAPYYDIIKDATRKMGNGMADYAENEEMIKNGVQTIDDYELYCHYVAGLVGEGLTSLFVASELANPKLAERPSLTESMAQFLQKTNIIRDLHEDWQDGRRWYPKEIWSQHVDKWEDLFDPSQQTKALECVSHMVLDALKHSEECLFYMAGIKDQSVFNFVAIPQGMAIATLELIFRNPDVLKKNVKITKGDACKIMFECTQNLYTVCEVFKRYARLIAKKNDPRDPNFLAISAQCAKVRLFIYQTKNWLLTCYRLSNSSRLYSPSRTPRSLLLHKARRKTRSLEWTLARLLFSLALLSQLWSVSPVLWYASIPFPRPYSTNSLSTAWYRLVLWSQIRYHL
jgi:farnesyl-diphosphate farnesyltransferase